MGAAVSCGLEGSVGRARRGDTGRSRRLAVDVDVARRASRVRVPTVSQSPCSTCSGPRSSPSGWTRSVSERCRGHAMAGETYKTLMDCNYLLFPCVLCIPNLPRVARVTAHAACYIAPRAKPQPRHGDTYVFDTRALRVHELTDLAHLILHILPSCCQPVAARIDLQQPFSLYRVDSWRRTVGIGARVRTFEPSLALMLLPLPLLPPAGASWVTPSAGGGPRRTIKGQWSLPKNRSALGRVRTRVHRSRAARGFASRAQNRCACPFRSSARPLARRPCRLCPAT